MKRYVCGFMFSSDRYRVALIQKNRPQWQAGRFNGIGGHIEGDESPARAMRREFSEETGVDHGGWDRFLVAFYPDAELHFFDALTDKINLVATKTDESVVVMAVTQALQHRLLIDNLRWILPLALEDIKNRPLFMFLGHDGAGS